MVSSKFSRRRHRTCSKTGQQRHLLLESLERRELMAANGFSLGNAGDSNLFANASPSGGDVVAVVDNDSQSALFAEDTGLIDVKARSSPGDQSTETTTPHLTEAGEHFEIPFSVATINSQFRPSELLEGQGIFGAVARAVDAGVSFVFGGGYDESVYETDPDSRARANLIMSEYFDFDIVAMQEVFDADQIRQLTRGANLFGSHYLSGPGTEVVTDSGLALVVNGNLSSQAELIDADLLTNQVLTASAIDPYYDRDAFALRDARKELDESFDHQRVEFDEEGATLSSDYWANKGFTISEVQIDDNNDDHFVYVVNAHAVATGSGSGAWYQKATRYHQFIQMNDYVTENTDGRHPVIFMGDFNTNDSCDITSYWETTPDEMGLTDPRDLLREQASTAAIGSPQHVAAQSVLSQLEVFDRYGSGCHYADLMNILDQPYDPFHDNGGSFNTADKSRNAYKYLFRDKDDADKYPREYRHVDNDGKNGPGRVDYILIRQGIDYGVFPDELRLEDGTDSPISLDTKLTADVRKEHDYLFGGDNLVAYPSDHFGLSANLVFVNGGGGPGVVRVSDTMDGALPGAFQSGPTTQLIEVEFDVDVQTKDLTSSPSSISILGPDGEYADIVQIRPIYHEEIDRFSLDSGDLFDDTVASTTAAADSQTGSLFSVDVPGQTEQLASDGEGGVCTGGCAHQTQNLLRRYAGQYTNRFEIVFQRRVTGVHTLFIGPEITDRFGHQMDQNNDGRQGGPSDRFKRKLHVNDSVWTVSATTTADVDGDGSDAVFTAYKDDKGITWIQRSDDTQTVTNIYQSSGGTWSVGAVAAGDVDGDGDDELFTAFEHTNGDARIYRSETGDSIGSRIYDSRVAGTWTIQALAVGDVDGDGDDELFSAFEHVSGDARIYRSETGNSIGSRIWDSKVAGTWTIQALAVGDVDGDGNDELFSALEHASGDARIYRSETGARIGSRIWDSKVAGTWTIQALAVGDVDGDGNDELFSAIEHVGGDARIYHSETGDRIGSRIYDSRVPGTWTIQALAVGDIDGDGDDELFSAFEHVNGYYRSETGSNIGSQIGKPEEKLTALKPLSVEMVDQLFSLF